MRPFLLATTMAASVAALSTLAGCTLIPKYERPAAPVSASYPTGRAFTADAPGAHGNDVTGGVQAASLGWRDFFTDPVLRDILALALANNRDLRVSALNVQAAQAEYRIQDAQLLPTVNATASADFERLSPAQTGTVASNTHYYGLGLGVASYEIDLFGRLRSLSREAQEEYLSLVDTKLSAQISLVAQVAATYLAWLADRDALRLSSETADAQERYFDLRTLTLSQGSGTELDVAQAESSLRTSQASVEQYTRQVAQDFDALVLLLGTPPPADLQARMMATSGLAAEAPFPELAAGLPSDLLERRPDIRAAEHSLRAANANIGAARAAFFPQVTLTASGGTASGGLNHLFGAGTGTFSFVPQISIPIFDGGSNRAKLDYAKVQKRIEIASYEKAIQSAFRDVADALAARATYVRQLEMQTRLVEADDRYRTISQMRFEAGVDDYLGVLVAQSSLFAAQLTRINLELAERQNLVTLYKALGGGWTDGAEAARK
jgi:multidrug efflux system outer membrane protein